MVSKICQNISRKYFQMHVLMSIIMYNILSYNIKCIVLTADERIRLGPGTSWCDFEFVLLWIHFYATDRRFVGRENRRREIDRLRSLQHSDPNDPHPGGSQIFRLSSHCSQSHRGSVRGMCVQEMYTRFALPAKYHRQR